jgi:hypothetical protein
MDLMPITRHLVDFWEANKDDPEFIEELYAAVLKKVPKITTTRDERNRVMVHLVSCPLAEEQMSFKQDLIQAVDVIKCSCIDK